MREVRVVSEINCTSEVFWKLFFDAEFNERLFKDGLKFEVAEVLELSETTRRMRCKPRIELPRALKKIAGDGFGYEERGRLENGVWRWTVIPTLKPDKVTNTGTVTVTPLGDNRCKRIDEMRIEAKIFGIGGLIESTSEKQVTSAWKRTAIFTNEWIAKHDLG